MTIHRFTDVYFNGERIPPGDILGTAEPLPRPSLPRKVIFTFSSSFVLSVPQKLRYSGPIHTEVDG